MGTKFMRMGIFLGLLMLVLISLSIGTPVPAQADTIEATRIIDRNMDVYFGTWTVFEQGNPNPIGSQTFVELTDRISDGLRALIEADASVDERVKTALPLWINLNQTNIEWVIAAPENLPAIANFNAAIAALGGSITTDSDFLFGGTQTYLLQSFVTSETGPVVAGDTDQPEFFGVDGDIVTVTNNFTAEVSFSERNGSVTLPASAVPEPGSGILLGISLAWYMALQVRRRLKRHGKEPA